MVLKWEQFYFPSSPPQPGDIWPCPETFLIIMTYVGVGDVIDTQWVEARDAVKHLKTHRTINLVQKVGKPCFKSVNKYWKGGCHDCMVTVIWLTAILKWVNALKHATSFINKLMSKERSVIKSCNLGLESRFFSSLVLTKKFWLLCILGLCKLLWWLCPKLNTTPTPRSSIILLLNNAIVVENLTCTHRWGEYVTP